MTATCVVNTNRPTLSPTSGQQELNMILGRHMADSLKSDSNTGRGPSPVIWDDCDILALQMNPMTKGVLVQEDFHNGPQMAANSTSYIGPISAFTDANTATIVTEADELAGALTLTPGTTDNEDCGIEILGGGNKGGAIKLSSTALKKFWFEARIKVSALTDSKLGVFCGFAQEAKCAADGIIADAGTTQDIDLVGFWRLEGDGDKLDTVHRKNGGALTAVKADAITLEADTYVKVGMKLDTSTGKLHFYSNGVRLPDNVAVSLATFPDGEELAFYFMCKTASGTAPGTATIDWVQIAQYY